VQVRKGRTIIPKNQAIKGHRKGQRENSADTVAREVFDGGKLSHLSEVSP